MSADCGSLGAKLTGSADKQFPPLNLALTNSLLSVPNAAKKSIGLAKSHQRCLLVASNGDGLLTWLRYPRPCLGFDVEISKKKKRFTESEKEK